MTVKGAEQMFRRSLGLLALTAVVALGVPDTSQAQYFRTGGWRGGDGWYGNRGWDGRAGFYYTAGYPYGVSFGYGRGYYPYGSWNSGYYPYGYSYSPGWYNGYRSGYYYSSPTYYTTDGQYMAQSSGNYSYRSAYSPEDIVKEMPDPGQSALAAVRVATPNAQLWIENQEMTSEGLLRTFISPPLESDKSYTYTIRSIWIDQNGKAVDRTKTVDVKAGKRVAVDFSEGMAEQRDRRSGYGPEAPPPARNRDMDRRPREGVVPGVAPRNPDGPREKTRRDDSNKNIPPVPNPGASTQPRNNGTEKPLPPAGTDKPLPPTGDNPPKAPDDK
jgi:uncharacterized protein (TIGR03000 family)